MSSSNRKSFTNDPTDGCGPNQRGRSRGSARKRRSRASAKAIRIAALVALVVGIAFVSYPFISNIIIQAAQEKVARENIAAVPTAGSERLAEERASAIAYNERMGASMAVLSDPFDPNAEIVYLDDYEQIMDLRGDGVMASLEIPEIGVFVPVYHGTSDDVLTKGAGHLVRTSLPVGGESTHCVLVGHTGLPSVKIFDDLEKLEEGSYVILYVLGDRLGYKVCSIEVVEPEETSSLAIVEGRDLLTLVTCTPYGVNSHRLLVHAERCSLDDEEAQAALARADEPSPLRWMIPLGIAIPVMVALFCVRVLRGAKKGSAGKHAAGASKNGWRR